MGRTVLFWLAVLCLPLLGLMPVAPSQMMPITTTYVQYASVSAHVSTLITSVNSSETTIYFTTFRTYTYSTVATAWVPVTTQSGVHNENQSDLILIEVVLASIAVFAFMLVFDYYIHRTKAGAIPPRQVTSEVNKVVTPVALPKPEPLPRLEPLPFIDVVRRSLVEYRANLILLVPLLVLFVQTQVTQAIFSRYLSPQVLNGIRSHAPITPAELSSLLVMALTLLLVSVTSLVVSFIVLLGQVSMTAKVVANGKTVLGDWPFGVRKYFSTVFGVSFIFSFLFLVPRYVPQQLYDTLKTIGPTAATAVYYLIREPLYNLVQSAFYVCLAAVGLDGRQFRASLQMGGRVILDRRSAFAGLFLLSMTVSLCLDGLSNLIAPILNCGPPPLKTSAYAFALIEIIPNALWFLIAFRLYRGFNQERDMTTQAQPETNMQSPIATARKQFCIECGAQLPLGSKLCSECGSKRE